MLRIFAGLRGRVYTAIGAGLALLVGGALGAHWLMQGKPCERTDRVCAAKRYQSHAVRTPAFWRAARTQPLESRVGLAPPELVEYLMLDTLLQDIPARPRASSVTPAFAADVRAALADIPANIRKIMDRRLIGIYFVDDIGGTGLTELVQWGAEDGAAFIVLDPTQLDTRKANAWATWKEGTPFKPDPAWRLDTRIADDGGSNRKNAILYILLHELGHVLATRGDIHPRWDRPPQESLKGGARFPFYSLSWKLDSAGTANMTLFDSAYANRRDVVYYFGAKLDAADMPAAYRWLEATNFPTLYAATNPGDDFAESFVSYVHTELMGRPWEISLIKDDQPVHAFRSCWRAPRCAEKRKLLEGIIAAEAGAEPAGQPAAMPPRN